MDVADCHVAKSVLEQPLGRLSPEALKCAPLICAQLLATSKPADGPQSGTRWLIPEPWNGHLATAPILFVGQNPSADAEELYPTARDLQDSGAGMELPQFFTERFGLGSDARIVGGTRVRRRDGKPSSANPFLGHVLKLASRILGRQAVPGEDYAITEAVRCKAARATGVEQALENCARFLPTTMELSSARVVIFLGSLARQAFERDVPVPERKRGKPFFLGERKAVFLAHPNARGDAVHKTISDEVAHELRLHILNARSGASP